MSNTKISQLPLYTGNTSGSYLVMNNSSETTTYKVLRENIIGASGTSGTSGTSGAIGASGSSGSSGTSGATGASGSSGTSGSSGVSPSVVGFITTGSIATTQAITGSMIISGSSTKITGSIYTNGNLTINDVNGNTLLYGNVMYIESTNGTTGSSFSPLVWSMGDASGDVYFNKKPGYNLHIQTTQTGSVTITGSANITNMMNLKEQSPLPAGTVGSLAVSGSNLFYHNGSSWSQIN